jgi:hypothetical protein
MTKTLLVLAASMYQIPAIETAKRLGYRVITTDNVPDNPAMPWLTPASELIPPILTAYSLWPSGKISRE